MSAPRDLDWSSLLDRHDAEIDRDIAGDEQHAAKAKVEIAARGSADVSRNQDLGSKKCRGL